MKLPQLSLRELLLLVLVVALGLAWWLTRSELQTLQIENRVLRQSNVSKPSGEDMERAIAAAEELLAASPVTKMEWGEVSRAEEGPANTITVLYPTPAKEFQMLGNRSIRVHRDDWTASYYERD